MQYMRLLLLPLSLVYAFIVSVRNMLYDKGVFKSTRFDIPVISIGNLAIGGAGKSPMGEYIIRLLKEKYKIAVLSRGYRRTTRGYMEVNPSHTALLVGDEPLQFKRKFNDITVAVCEKRVVGIKQLEHTHHLVVLDDAFQHRAVRPGLNLLLFDYSKLNDFHLTLPAGNLREPFSNRSRADLLIVSKCPRILSLPERENIKNRVRPLGHQHLFFTYLDYGKLVSLHTHQESSLDEISGKNVFLLSGIANPEPLVLMLNGSARRVVHHDYPDHHIFSTKNISKLAEDFRRDTSSHKLIITTEKDAQRLYGALLELLNGLPVYYLPVRAKIHEPDEERFNDLIESYVTGHIQHHRIRQE